MHFLYFNCLGYTKKSLDYLSSVTELVILENPNDLTTELPSINAVFAPLGYMLDSNYLAYLPNLRCVISNTTGIPHIDVQSCLSRNIRISALHDQKEFLQKITPTAEHTFGLIHAAHRRIVRAHNAVIHGNSWNRRQHGAPYMLSRASLGIVGYGRVGSKVGKIGNAIGMKVSFYDPYVRGSLKTLEELFTECDIVAVCAVATDETRGIVSKELMSLLGSDGIVVNTARGELLDLDGLIDLLGAHNLYSAAIDTIDGEYGNNLTSSSPFRRATEYAKTHENLIITPHIAGSTVDAWQETEMFVITRAIRMLRGEE